MSVSPAWIMAGDSKDVILVLDTSLSMVGYGGKNILPRVKKSINQYIDTLEDDDRVTFLTFDTSVKVYPSVLVDDENDRDILKKYISMTPARGKWTHTYQMVQSVFQQADALEKDDNGRQVIIVVMTDGIDDPPPYSRRNRLNIKSLSNKYSGKDWWIYFINYGDIKKTKKAVSLRKKFEKQMKKVGRTTFIDTGAGTGVKPEEAVSRKIPEHVKQLESEISIRLLPFFIVFLVIAVVLGIIYYLKRIAGVLVTGKIECWNNEVLDRYIESFEFTGLNLKEVTVGSDFRSAVNLRDFALKTPLVIRAIRVDNDIRLTIEVPEGITYSFKNKEYSEYIDDGDIFEVANFTFKYMKS